MKPDWRANISDHDSLYDLDPVQIMILLRHQYLEAAKDLTPDDNDPRDQRTGDMACVVAEALQEAIEAQFSEANLINLEPSG